VTRAPHLELSGGLQRLRNVLEPALTQRHLSDVTNLLLARHVQQLIHRHLAARLHHSFRMLTDGGGVA
jgi:hypothetical protein